MSATAAEPPLPAAPRAQARRTLAGTGLAHALHDGYTEMIYVLLPVWQAEFGLGKAALPAFTALLLTAVPWRPALWLLAILGALTTAAVWALVPAFGRPVETAAKPERGGGGGGRGGFGLLFATGVLDSGAHRLPDVPPLSSSNRRARTCRWWASRSRSFSWAGQLEVRLRLAGRAPGPARDGAGDRGRDGGGHPRRDRAAARARSRPAAGARRGAERHLFRALPAR